MTWFSPLNCRGRGIRKKWIKTVGRIHVFLIPSLFSVHANTKRGRKAESWNPSSYIGVHRTLSFRLDWVTLFSQPPSPLRWWARQDQVRATISSISCYTFFTGRDVELCQHVFLLSAGIFDNLSIRGPVLLAYNVNRSIEWGTSVNQVLRFLQLIKLTLWVHQ